MHKSSVYYQLDTPNGMKIVYADIHKINNDGINEVREVY